MIIEFAGLPGAGKSTVALQLLDALDTEGAGALAGDSLAADPGVLFLARLRSVVRHPRFVASVLRYAWRSPRPASERWLLLRMIVVSLHRFDEAKALGRSKPVIFHEGIVQRSFLALVEANSVGAEADVERYLRHAPRPDVVVWLRVDPLTCLERIVCRERGVPKRLSSLSSGAVVERFTQGEAMFDQVLRDLRSTGDTVIARIDGTASNVLEQVVHALEPFPMTFGQ